MARGSKVSDLAETVRPRESQKDELFQLLPSGSSMLNLALADNVYGGIKPGTIINIAGEFGVGKTMIAETIAAEIAHNPAFDGLDIIYDEPERAMAMDIGRLFGQKTLERLQAPRVDEEGQPVYSETVEQFFANVLARIDAKKPFVYLLDSLDALPDQSEVELGADLRKDAEKAGADLTNLNMKGNYGGVPKAKLMSQILRIIVSGLHKTKSTLFIISQIRENISRGYGQSSKVKSGGKALDFYSSVIVFLDHKQKIEKTLKSGAKFTIGALVVANVTKNKLTGKKRKVEFSIFYDYGIDDLTSCIDFLVAENVIERKGSYFQVEGLFDGLETGYRGIDKLVKAIESAGAPTILKVKELVQRAWTEKEDGLKLGRKPRFGSE